MALDSVDRRGRWVGVLLGSSDERDDGHGPGFELRADRALSEPRRRPARPDDDRHRLCVEGNVDERLGWPVADDPQLVVDAVEHAQIELAEHLLTDLVVARGGLSGRGLWLERVDDDQPIANADTPGGAFDDVAPER